MNDLETAQQRRLDAELSEALGNDMPEDLASRVVAGLPPAANGAQPDDYSADNYLADTRREPSHRRTVWLAAAGLLFGVIVVASVARLRNEQSAENNDRATVSAQDPQDPKYRDTKAAIAPVATITDESLSSILLKETAADLPPPGDTLERLSEIANEPSINLVATALVNDKGKSNVDLRGCTPTEAIERIAAERNLQVTEQRGALIVGSVARSGRVGQRLTLSCKQIPMRSFLKKMHAKTGVNFVLAGDVVGTVICDVKDVPWQSALREVCKQLKLEVIGCGTVLAIRPRLADPQQPRLRFNFEQHPVGDILSTWAKIGGKNLIIDPKVTGKLTVKTSDLSLDGLLHGLTQSVNASIQVEGKGITRIVPGLLDWSTDLTMELATVAQALELNGGGKHTTGSTSKAKVSVFVREATGRHMIDAIHTAVRLPITKPEEAKPNAGK